MTDIADQAERQEQLARDAALAQVPLVDLAVIGGTGECLNCGEPLSAGRWCDVYCRNDWTARNDRK